MKKTILVIGKVKDQALLEKIDYYYKRTKDISLITLKETTSEEDIIKKVENKDVVFVLSEEGRQYTSRQFAGEIQNSGKDISEMVFVIGGANGFDKPITFGDKVISLSKMTFTHEMCLLFLMEQLYRCEQISKGTSYHRD